MTNPVIVALDLDDPKKALDLAQKVAPHVGGFKVGPRLTFRSDRQLLKQLSQLGTVFFDHKFFDIPSTTVASVKAAAEMGADWVTVHALNGPECLKELATLETQIKKTNSKFKILAVTVLTSFKPESLPPIWKSQSMSQSVLDLATSVFEAGLTSLVCSSEEAEVLKNKFPKSFLVVPGIRPEGSDKNDQSRVATPAQALKAGASALVIGRPIVESSDPLATVKKIQGSLP